VCAKLGVTVNINFSFSFVRSLFFWTCLLYNSRETFPTWYIPHHSLLGGKWLIHFMINVMDYLKPLPIPFKMHGSTSQVSSGYLYFNSSRALFCYVRRSKMLIQCGSFVISFTEILVFSVEINCQLPCHIQIYGTLWQCSTVIWLNFYSCFCFSCYDLLFYC
jgi:hypothetical protein